MYFLLVQLQAAVSMCTRLQVLNGRSDQTIGTIGHLRCTLHAAVCMQQPVHVALCMLRGKHVSI